MRIIRMREVTDKTGLARSTILRLIANHTFPPAHKLGCKSVGWAESDVNNWLLEKVAERNKSVKMTAKQSDSPTSDTSPEISNIRILRLRQVLRDTGLSRSTIYQLISIGAFPASVRLGERVTGWIEKEVTEWLRSTVNSDA